MADAGIYWQAFTDYSTDSISYALGLRKSALAPFDSIKYMLMCAAMGAGCAWMGFLQWKSGEEISEVAGGGAIAFVIAIVVLGFRR